MRVERTSLSLMELRRLLWVVLEAWRASEPEEPDLSELEGRLEEVVVL